LANNQNFWSPRCREAVLTPRAVRPLRFKPNLKAVLTKRPKNITGKRFCVHLKRRSVKVRRPWVTATGYNLAHGDRARTLPALSSCILPFPGISARPVMVTHPPAEGSFFTRVRWDGAARSTFGVVRCSTVGGFGLVALTGLRSIVLEYSVPRLRPMRQCRWRRRVESAGDGEAHRAQRRVIQFCSFAFRPSESAGRRNGVLREMADRGERRGQGGDSEGSTAQLSKLADPRRHQYAVEPAAEAGG
jgi:hypothetical protein